MPLAFLVPTQSPARVSTTSGSPEPSQTRCRTVQILPSRRMTPPRAGTRALQTAQGAAYRLTELISVIVVVVGIPVSTNHDPKRRRGVEGFGEGTIAETRFPVW